MRQIIVILGVIALIVIGALIIFAIPWGGSGKPKQTVKETQLVDFASSDTKVKMFVRGKINSQKEHQDLQIVVGRDQASVTLYRGYEQDVVRQRSFDNNSEGYRLFLSALANSGFLLTKKAPKGVSEDGACPTGQRFIFSFAKGKNLPPTSWTTSCSQRVGTFAGAAPAVEGLFQKQIPNYDEFTRNTEF